MHHPVPRSGYPSTPSYPRPFVATYSIFAPSTNAANPIKPVSARDDHRRLPCLALPGFACSRLSSPLPSQSQRRAGLPDEAFLVRRHHTLSLQRLVILRKSRHASTAHVAADPFRIPYRPHRSLSQPSPCLSERASDHVQQGAYHCGNACKRCIMIAATIRLTAGQKVYHAHSRFSMCKAHSPTPDTCSLQMRVTSSMACRLACEAALVSPSYNLPNQASGVSIQVRKLFLLTMRKKKTFTKSEKKKKR